LRFTGVDGCSLLEVSVMMGFGLVVVVAETGGASFWSSVV
jgi:hypothetical protein